MGTMTNRDSALRGRSIDALFELYVSWREECDAVQQAYQRWADSRRGERLVTYAGYIAALDREELAALAYADETGRVNRIST